MPLPDQGNLAMLQLISQAPFKQDLLKCPEAITLQTALNIGEVSPLVLLNQVKIIPILFLQYQNKNIF